MTTHTGDEGLVKIGANTVAEVRSFEFTLTSGVIEDTAKGDASVTRKPGRKDANGQVTCWWDQDDTNGQVAMVEGAEVTLLLQVEGDASGDIQYTIPSIIQSVQHLSPEGESIAEAIFTFIGSAATSRQVLA